jgi:hypothetical protein
MLFAIFLDIVPGPLKVSKLWGLQKILLYATIVRHNPASTMPPAHTPQSCPGYTQPRALATPLEGRRMSGFNQAIMEPGYPGLGMLQVHHFHFTLGVGA